LPVKELRPPVALKVFVIVIVPDAEERFVFPATSLNEFAATVTVPVPLDVL
jgi:hypothetical protein